MRCTLARHARGEHGRGRLLETIPFYEGASMAIAVRHKPLVLNTAPVRLRNLIGLAAMLAPGLLFVAALGAAARFDPRFVWLSTPQRYPWELWVIAISGLVATAGG